MTEKQLQSNLLENTAAGTESTATEAESTATCEGEEPFSPKQAALKKAVAIAICIILGVALLAMATLTGLLYFYGAPQTVDLDSTVSLGAMENCPLLSAIVKFDTPPTSIDTSSVSDQTLDVTFWGYLHHTVPISVRDLTPPTAETYEMIVPLGTVFDASECIRSHSDKTAVTFAFAKGTAFDTAGAHTVTVIATDEGGNQTAVPVSCTVLPRTESEAFSVEFGITENMFLSEFSRHVPQMTDISLGTLDFSIPGTYTVSGFVEGTADTRRLCTVVLNDTVAPTGRARSYTFPIGAFANGEALQPEQFISNLNDASPITVSYVTEPDYTSLSLQSITVSAIDAMGNETRFESVLQLLDIPTSFTMECGTPTDEFLSLLLKNVPEELHARLSSPVPDISKYPSGTHTLRLRGDYSILDITVTVVDTVPPALETKTVYVYVGQTPNAENFVKRVTDANTVTFSFAAMPSTDAPGTYPVGIVATDLAGNSTSCDAEMIVIHDTVPPVIYGVDDIIVPVNSTVSFRSGVTAYDAVNGKVSVRVSADTVNLNKSGTYSITYTATDNAGNTATRTARVYVVDVNMDAVNLYADRILAKLGTANMENDRQRAAAIYKWCYNTIRYSTSTANLMGNFVGAAYSGFTTYAGNCYTYYAVAAVLLTRAGIENIEICRDSDDPHFWNLVKIDGAWYHFDTCPKLPDYPIKTFLLTDAEVIHYSTFQAVGYYKFDASLYPATP